MFSSVGESYPTEDWTDENMRFLSSQQGLADMAAFIEGMNEEHGLTGAWVTFGGSYSGSLSAWARQTWAINIAIALELQANKHDISLGTLTWCGLLFLALDLLRPSWTSGNTMTLVMLLWEPLPMVLSASRFTLMLSSQLKRCLRYFISDNI